MILAAYFSGGENNAFDWNVLLQGWTASPDPPPLQSPNPLPDCDPNMDFPMQLSPNIEIHICKYERCELAALINVFAAAEIIYPKSQHQFESLLCVVQSFGQSNVLSA